VTLPGKRAWWVFLAAALLIAGCESPRKDVIVFAIATAPVSLHPFLANDATSERINALIYRPLIEFDQAQRPVAGQVEWEQQSTTHYRLRLRAGIVPFSDGTLPTLQDVSQTLRQASSDPRSPHAVTLAHIHSLSVQEEQYLDVHLSRPDPRFAEKLHIGLAPADRLTDDSLMREPMGNGVFVLQHWDAQNNLMLRRRDGQLLRFEVVPDPTMRALKLIRGEVQLLQNDLPYELYPLLKEKPDIELRSNQGATFAYLGFNFEDELTGDRRVRQAIAHAVDRETIVKYLFQGNAQITNTLLRPEHWAAHRALPAYAFDLQRAKGLLEELGYSEANPLVLSYKTSTDPFRLRIAAVLQAQLAEVGIKLDIQSYEWGTFFGDIKAGRFQMYSLSWVGIRSPDIFRYVFHSESLPPNGANRGRYRSSLTDALIEEADALPSEKAATAYHRAQEQIHRDLVYVPLWHENNLLLTRGIDAPGPATDGNYRFLERISLRHD